MNKENSKVITQDAKELIESLFETQNTKTRTLSGSKLKFTGEKYLNKAGHENDYRAFIFTHFIKFYKKYSRNWNYEEFISLYSVALTEACAALGDRFPDFEEFKNDRKIQMQTMKYLKTNVEYSLWRMNNEDSIQTKNKGKNVFVHADVSSIDAIQQAYSENDNEFELDDSNKIWGSVDEDRLYEWNPFVQNFIKNKDRVMTKKQQVYYEKIKEVYVPKNAEITKKEMLENIGYTQAQNAKFMQNIAKRAEEDFEQFCKKKAINEDYRSNLHKKLNQFIETADSDENVRNMQMNLSRLISENYETEDFEIIITEGLSTEEKIHIVRSVKGKHYVSNKVLYKIYDNILTYIENNEMIEVEASEAKSTYSESILGNQTGESTHYYINSNGSVSAANFEDITEEGAEIEHKEKMQ